MTHEEKAVAIAYARGVMDVLSVMVRAQMIGDEDKYKLECVAAYAANRLRDVQEETDDGEKAN